MSDYWPYYFLWFFVEMFLPDRKAQKGYIWRAVRVTLFRYFWKMKPPKQMFRRFVIFSLFIWYIIEIFVPASELKRSCLFFAFLTVVSLDDYLNGDDDDRKKRWDIVRNKIKWRMELPPQPQEETAGS